MRLLLSTCLLPAQGFGVSKLPFCYERLLYTDPQPKWYDVLQYVYLVISMTGVLASWLLKGPNR